jgi:glycosyltransferase involved in cell wall biosynthesis
VFLSIIIPAYNEEKCIPSCLRAAFAACRTVAEGGPVSPRGSLTAGPAASGNSLLACRPAASGNSLLACGPVADEGFRFEVLVVDNNSTDRTAALARGEGAAVVFEPKNQIARARNRGADAAKGEWFIFLDADSTLSADLLADTVHAMRSGRVAGGGALLRFPDGASRVMRFGEKVWAALSRTFRWAAGSYVFCRADLFRETGGFNESLYISEEIDFSRRLKRLARRKGLRFVILTRFPLLTSDRKISLYSPSALLRFWLRLLAAPRKTRRNRESCDIWYDGKR